MATQNSVNFNSADFDVTAGTFELTDEVVKSAATDSGTATPSSHSLTFTGTGGISTSGATDTVTIDGSGISSYPVAPTGLVYIATDCTGSITISQADTTDWKLEANAKIAVQGHPGVYELTAANGLYSNWFYTSDGDITMYAIGRANWSLGAGDRLYFGLWDNLTLSSVADGIYWALDQSAGYTTWYAVTENTNTKTATDSSIATGTSWHTFSITVDTSGTNAVFAIDGSTKATHTTNLPATSTAMYCGFYTQNALNGEAYIDYISFQQDITR